MQPSDPLPADSLPDRAVRLGSIVGYVLPDGPNRFQVRAALVVRVLDAGAGVVNLVVYRDGPNDGGRKPIFTHTSGDWVATVRYDPVSRNPGTWHFLEGPSSASKEPPRRGDAGQEAGDSQQHPRPGLAP